MEFYVMSSSDWSYTILFIMFVLIFTYPPAAVIASGLTLENIFSHIIGIEQKEFVIYHIKRSTVTLILHSFLPLIYYIYMCNMSDSIQFLQFQSLFWKFFFQFALLVPTFVCSVATFWYQSNWNRHPIAEKIFIGSGIPNRDNWRNVAVDINNEMKSIEKFVSGVVPSKKIIITSNWLVKTDLYSISVAQQTRVSLSVEQCNIYPISANRNSDDDHVENISNSSHVYGEVQYLKIAVKDILTKLVYFHFSVNSNEYEDIKAIINAPVIHATGVVIHQTLGEKFAAAFKEQVLTNPVTGNTGMPNNYLAELCIGCSQEYANVKLVKNCESSGSAYVDQYSDHNGACGTCYCRPLWCVECLGKWFASRQLVAKKEPGIWMSQKAPCPTCRSVFCILDVIVLPN